MNFAQVSQIVNSSAFVRCFKRLIYLLVFCSIIVILTFLLTLHTILLHTVNWKYSLCKLKVVAYKIFPPDNFPNFSIAFKNEVSWGTWVA